MKVLLLQAPSLRSFYSYKHLVSPLQGGCHLPRKISVFLKRLTVINSLMEDTRGHQGMSMENDPCLHRLNCVCSGSIKGLRPTHEFREIYPTPPVSWQMRLIAQFFGSLLQVEVLCIIILKDLLYTTFY